jgi:hypothetical protein
MQQIGIVVVGINVVRIECMQFKNISELKNDGRNQRDV